MLNIRRIEWMYENFGVAAAVKSATKIYLQFLHIWAIA